MGAADKYIPASALTLRIEKIRAKITSLAQQIEGLRVEEKLLGTLLDDAVDPVASDAEASPGPLVTSRARGVVDGIIGFIQGNPGTSRAELVAGLKYLNLNPFDQNAARRTILNNLGNQLRSGKLREDESGLLYLTDETRIAS